MEPPQSEEIQTSNTMVYKKSTSIQDGQQNIPVNNYIFNPQCISYEGSLVVTYIVPYCCRIVLIPKDFSRGVFLHHIW